MATRFYFSDTAPAAVSPTISGTDWGHVNTDRKGLSPGNFIDNSTLANTTFTPDAADHLTDINAHVRQYVSPPLTAQAISGTFKACLQCFEANAGNNLFLTIKIYVVNNSGSSVTGTCLGPTRDDSELGTALISRFFASTGITTVNAAENDRLVVEIGAGGLPVASGGTQGHNLTVRFGTNASGGDLAETDADTGTTVRGWIEFSSNISFQTYPDFGVMYRVSRKVMY